MKRILLMALIVCVTPSLCEAQTTATNAASNSDSNLEQELRRVARERILAFDEGDKSVWSPYVDEAYIIATPAGGVRTKRQIMQGFRPPLAGYSDLFEFEDVHVKRDGDVAVMSYIINEYEYRTSRDTTYRSCVRLIHTSGAPGAG